MFFHTHCYASCLKPATISSPLTWKARNLIPSFIHHTPTSTPTLNQNKSYSENFKARLNMYKVHNTRCGFLKWTDYNCWDVDTSINIKVEVNYTDIKAPCIQFNESVDSSSHSAEEMKLSNIWMSLPILAFVGGVDVGYPLTPTVAPSRFSPSTLMNKVMDARSHVRGCSRHPVPTSPSRVW